MKGDINNLKEG